jgi:hypothetical protein
MPVKVKLESDVSWRFVIGFITLQNERHNPRDKKKL